MYICSLCKKSYDNFNDACSCFKNCCRKLKSNKAEEPTPKPDKVLLDKIKETFTDLEYLCNKYNALSSNNKLYPTLKTELDTKPTQPKNAETVKPTINNSDNNKISCNNCTNCYKNTDRHKKSTNSEYDKYVYQIDNYDDFMSIVNYLFR